MLYIIVSSISFIVRAYLCYRTIENVPILSNPIANSILWEVVPVYTILMLICRKIVGLFYSKGEAPVFGAIAYFIIYMVALFIVYVSMLILTKFGVLPI